jgi:hypothetical protein
MVVGEVMNKLKGKRRGINWGTTEQLQDTKFASDMRFLHHAFVNAESSYGTLKAK